ncbi:hypothetical protein [Nodularia spumigena]|uniref:Type IV secretion system protein virB5 n=1 Tax=Nodularia spumigena UHCC 0060 TaxID=3110300 RepID=A0ABU5UVZ7_NODSP|nr:hypothetical protein [Nodularia spumigena]MDB9322350.1 hypothetical protein [Nodularia spumigena CS-591/07A]MDB9330910.1 hypothetical protein [Nodularia spumigena CS-591/04]MDB9360215.1 hypothetical protein [Nodularia spumigena CS-588/02]MDB9366158.1 hypothetical protein [Nodularia spumigena CS-588/02A10]MEA5527843.1 hypothetical protein [Nodularia spumigena UHCC 0143]
MKFQLHTIRLVTLILVWELGFVASPVMARTQDNGRDPLAAAVQNQTTGNSIFTSNTAAQINDFVGDVKNFVQNDLFNPLGNLLNSALGAFQIPDLNQILAGIMNGAVNNDPGAVLSETLENKTNGQSSYGIREDFGKFATRTVATGVANQATLSQTAQNQMAEIKQATRQDTQAIVSLGEESQNLDVTQQILQNLSQQTALNSRVNERMLEESQQARIDRALINTITAQTAKELSAINTADRRKSIAAGNAATQQMGLLIMPGGMTLGAD